MACREDHKDYNENSSDCLNRLGHDVGNLRFQMRNTNDSIVSELLASSAVEESKATEALPSHLNDDKSENDVESFPFSLSNQIFTAAIQECKDDEEQIFVCQEYLRTLQEVEAELKKKFEEMCHKYEKSFYEIIHS